MQRIVVQLCAQGLLAWMLVACVPETAAAPAASAPTTTRENPVKQSAPADAGARSATQTAKPPEAPMRASMSAAMPTMPSAGTMQASGAAGKAAAMDASVPKMTGAQTDASTAPASNAECTKLSTCCGGLMDDDDRSDCQELVMRNDAMRCTRASAELCQMPTMPSTPSEACMKLSTCCATLGRAPLTRDCEQTVERADAERCTRQLDQRCPELAPVPQEPACATLHACCPKLMEPQLEVCRRALQDGDQRDCARASMQLCQ